MAAEHLVWHLPDVREHLDVRGDGGLAHVDRSDDLAPVHRRAVPASSETI